jgi:cytosine/adenosine deaminase-related metal-dependent hydrolase
MLLALLVFAAPLQAAEIRDTVLTLGKPSGTQVRNCDGGKCTATFEYNDRGRGPETTATWTLDANGMPAELTVTGKSYLKTPVDERFTRTAKGSQWHNENEDGESANAAAYYAPIGAPPAYAATLVHAIERAKGGALALLPAGEARLERVGEQTAVSKSGEKTKVIAYEIAGLDFTPATVWLDERGEYFASVSAWFAVIRAGYEDATEPLLKFQNERENARAAELAKRLCRVPGMPLLVKNARVFDPRDGSVTAGMSVLVEGNRISALASDGRIPALPAKVETIDARGRFLMPGLWDNHVHLGGIDGMLHLAAGITSVRDMANDEAALPARVARYDKGEELGPRVLMAGFMDGRGKFAGPTKVFVDDEAEATKWVNWYADHGYVQIKVYSSLKPELVPVIARLAHARGLRLSGHVPAFMTAQEFVEAGADEIQHLNFVFLNFLTKEAADTRDMTRFTAVAEHAVEIKPEGERERALIELFKRRHTTLDVTVNFFSDMFNGKAGQVTPGYEPIVPRLPPLVGRGLKGGNLEVPKGQEEHYAGAFDSMLRFLKGLYDAGVTLVPGTDSFVGFAYHRELELWSRAGIPNAAVLRAATLGSAEVNRRAGDLGVVAPGKLADFILIDGDPLAKISDIRRVRVVVKDGVVFDADALYAAVGVKAAP